jgi:hypothetical protein
LRATHNATPNSFANTARNSSSDGNSRSSRFLVAIAFITRDPLHTACLIAIVNAMTFGLFVIARRFRRRTPWRGWGAYSVAGGLLTLAGS